MSSFSPEPQALQPSTPGKRKVREDDLPPAGSDGPEGPQAITPVPHGARGATPVEPEEDNERVGMQSLKSQGKKLRASISGAAARALSLDLTLCQRKALAPKLSAADIAPYLEQISRHGDKELSAMLLKSKSQKHLDLDMATHSSATQSLNPLPFTIHRWSYTLNPKSTVGPLRYRVVCGGESFGFPFSANLSVDHKAKILDLQSVHVAPALQSTMTKFLSSGNPDFGLFLRVYSQACEMAKRRSESFNAMMLLKGSQPSVANDDKVSVVSPGRHVKIDVFWKLYCDSDGSLKEEISLSPSVLAEGYQGAESLMQRLQRLWGSVVNLQGVPSALALIARLISRA